MKKTQHLLALAGILVLFLTGCAHYQYVIVEPPNYGQPLTKQPTRVDLAPLSYQFYEREKQLVMQINNPTDGPITLLGQKSYVVDPKGRSQPLRGGIIAPHSYIGMRFPPRPVHRTAVGSSVGVGVGFGGPNYSSGIGFNSGMGFYEDPFFYNSSQASPYVWDWKTGAVRMGLFYQQWNPTNTFEHQFIIERRKAK